MKYIVIAIASILKLFYIKADVESLLFILRPINKIINLLTNTGSILVADSGYFNSSLNIIIDKSCSGFNFMIICFVMTSFSTIKYAKTGIQKIILIPFLLITSYFLTIFVNTSRIMFSLMMSHVSIVNKLHLSWLHKAEGVFIYIFFLVSIYLITVKIIAIRNKKDEQFS